MSPILDQGVLSARVDEGELAATDGKDHRERPGSVVLDDPDGWADILAPAGLFCVMQFETAQAPGQVVTAGKEQTTTWRAPSLRCGCDVRSGRQPLVSSERFGKGEADQRWE